MFGGRRRDGTSDAGTDWSATPLGPVSGWPQSLKVALGILLGSRYPMFVWWGRQMIMFHNDAYAPILGERHPDALGKSGPAVWSEIWDDIRPRMEPVLHEGRASWAEERLLVMERNGYTEETYFTFSYSPVPDDHGGVGGIFCACTEDTERVLGERRLRTLRELAAGRPRRPGPAEDACGVAADGWPPNRARPAVRPALPARRRRQRRARLVGRTGLPDGSPAPPDGLDPRRRRRTPPGPGR